MGYDMTREQMIDLVKRYFRGVDDMDFDAVAGTLDAECVFTVETHGARFLGHAEVERMLRRLWDDHAAVSHRDFTYVPDPEEGRIAARFSVVNTDHDGNQAHKSNCNFFEIRDRRFSRIAVYMAGENTLMSD